MSIAFIACVERGNLENQTLLLCRSIRRYAGRYAGAAIYTYQPRRGLEIGRDTRVALEGLHVDHSEAVLNVEYEHYGYGNKIFACARAEATLREDVLVFLDSDTFFTREPVDLDLPEGTIAAARPAPKHEGGITSTGPGDPKDGYWRSLYDLCRIDGEPFVETDADRRRVRAYFNAGLVAVRRDAGLFTKWRETFLLVSRAGLLPPDAKRGIKNLDEITLALTLAGVFSRLLVLDPRYNYPLHRRAELSPPLRVAQLEQLVHVHYHGWFNKPGYLSGLLPPLDPEGEIVQWLGQHIPFQPYLSEEP